MYATETANDASTNRGSPIRPARSSSPSAIHDGWKRVHIASPQNSPRSAAKANSSSASRAVVANGFSHSTCFPASRHARTCPAWSAFGVAT